MTPRERLDAAVTAVTDQIKARRHHAALGVATPVPPPMGMPGVCATIAKRSGLYLDFDDLRFNYEREQTVRIRVYEGVRTRNPLAVVVAQRADDRKPLTITIDEPQQRDLQAMSRGGRIGPESADTWQRADRMFSGW